MKVLVAEDDRVSRQILTTWLKKWGYDIVIALDGEQAWEELQKPDAPAMAILDWMMPGLDGLEITRRVRALVRPIPTYVMLLTARADRESVVAGLEAGANDYLTKPVDSSELRARVHAARQMVELQEQLSERVAELERAMSEVRSLQELLPICCYCKKIREGDDYQQDLEDYLASRGDMTFSHGVCPTCADQMRLEFSSRRPSVTTAL